MSAIYDFLAPYITEVSSPDDRFQLPFFGDPSPFPTYQWTIGNAPSTMLFHGPPPNGGQKNIPKLAFRFGYKQLLCVQIPTELIQQPALLSVLLITLRSLARLRHAAIFFDLSAVDGQIPEEIGQLIENTYRDFSNFTWFATRGEPICFQPH